MFKNIELSEINKDNVVRSLWLLLGLVASFVLLTFIVSLGFSKDGLQFKLVFYGILQFIFFGWPMWGAILGLLFFIEYLVLGKKSTTKTVRILFVFELFLPILSFMISIFSGEFDFMEPFVIGGIVLAQWLRWRYLLKENRMYHCVK